MTSLNDRGSVNATHGTERRTNQRLREVFEHAYQVAYPIIQSNQNLSTGGSAHFLRVALHDAFPDLHLQDVAILSVSIERVYRERSRQEQQK
jgi:hypothetical protein